MSCRKAANGPSSLRQDDTNPYYQHPCTSPLQEQHLKLAPGTSKKLQQHPGQGFPQLGIFHLLTSMQTSPPREQFWSEMTAALLVDAETLGCHPCSRWQPVSSLRALAYRCRGAGLEQWRVMQSISKIMVIVLSSPSQPPPVQG